MKTAYHFFLKWAGYSHDPKTETRLQGRIRCAQSLAEAERLAAEMGATYEWSIDPCGDSSDWSDEQPAWQQWQCIMRDDSEEIIASLHGIDFGRDGSPWSDPYKRVVEAELASEAQTNLEAAREAKQEARIRRDVRQAFIGCLCD